MAELKQTSEERLKTSLKFLFHRLYHGYSMLSDEGKIDMVNAGFESITEKIKAGDYEHNYGLRLGDLKDELYDLIESLPTTTRRKEFKEKVKAFLKEQNATLEEIAGAEIHMIRCSPSNEQKELTIQHIDTYVNILNSKKQEHTPDEAFSYFHSCLSKIQDRDIREEKIKDICEALRSATGPQEDIQHYIKCIEKHLYPTMYQPESYYQFETLKQ